jgi:hypothetical protein
MSDKAAGQKTRSPEGCDGNGRGGGVARRLRIDSDMRPPRALPAAHFDRNALVTDLVH